MTLPMTPWKTKSPDDAGYPGRFIVFEGIDGSGKTTQASLLAGTLKHLGIGVLLTAEPSDGPTGLLIRSLETRPAPLEEARLFTEDRSRHVTEVILPALIDGVTVICDRYVYSSVAYQGARGIAREDIIRWNRPFALAPDIIFLLEIPVHTALSRIGAGRLNVASPFEIREDLEAVAAIYEGLSDPLIRRIDATLRPDEVHSKILSFLPVLDWFTKVNSPA